jgi:hypothetical protein
MRATFKVFFRASANLGSPDIRHHGDSSQSFLGLVSGLEICEAAPQWQSRKGGLGVLATFLSFLLAIFDWQVANENLYENSPAKVTLDWDLPGFGRGFAVNVLFR